MADVRLDRKDPAELGGLLPASGARPPRLENPEKQNRYQCGNDTNVYEGRFTPTGSRGLRCECVANRL